MIRETSLHKLIIATVLVVFCILDQATAQSSELDDISYEDFAAELDDILSDTGDSLGIFQLLDSLLEDTTIPSQMAARIGYSSRVTSAGRDFGLDQQGVSPGVSYYHRSGLYADVTGVWNSALDPKYNLTITTLGYLGTIGKKWTYGFSYDHTFFHSNDPLEVFPLTNSLGTSASVDFKKVYTGVDYSFSFGEETAHRLIWTLSGYVKLKPFGPFKSITFLPSLAILWGNQNTTQSYFNINRFEQIKNLTREQLRNIAQSGDYSNEQVLILARIRALLNRDDLTPNQRRFVNDFFTSIEDFNTFGLMNYNLSFPISFSTEKIGFIMSYNYNIPVELEGSEYSSESNGYINCTLTYRIEM